MQVRTLCKASLVCFAVVATLIATVSPAVDAQVQDEAVIGTVAADPATVPAPGNYTFAAAGADFIPNTRILLLGCTSPAEALVPGSSDLAEITAAAGMINALADCDIANAQTVAVDGSGSWSAQLTAEVGDNFFLSAGALDGSQAGATWIPITGATDALAVAEAAIDEAQAEVEAVAAELEEAQAEAAADAELAAAEAEQAAAELAAAEAAVEEAESAADEAAEPEALAETGVETRWLAAVGLAAVGTGALAMVEDRRFRTAKR